jgi:hypothetical protein
MNSYERKQVYMSEWTDGSLINEEVINSLTFEQLNKLAEILKDVK